MLCAFNAMLKVLLTLAAAATVVDPACEATTVHDPAVSTEIVPLELIVQTAGVEEANEIGSEADDEAVTIGADSSNADSELLLRVNVMVWAVFTANVWVTGVAALNLAATPG